MVNIESEVVLRRIPDKERRFLDLPPYRRDGLIPSWAEVVVRFNLQDFHPQDIRLLRGYYRANRRLAEGRPKKATRIFDALFKKQDFTALEKREERLLSDISSFVRGPTERQRTK